MDNIKIWTFSLCGALFITAIFRIIISGSRLEKSVNIFLSVFIFLYAVLPINNIEFRKKANTTKKNIEIIKRS